MSRDNIDGLGRFIHDASRLMRRRFEQRTTEYGLSSAQWRLLARAAKDPGVAQARLAEVLEIEPISVSRLVDRMEEGGWIERRPDPADRRVRQIFPTGKSLAAFGAIRNVAHGVYEEALAGLDEKARRALIEGLETVVNNLSDGDTLCQNTAKEETETA